MASSPLQKRPTTLEEAQRMIHKEVGDFVTAEYKNAGEWLMSFFCSRHMPNMFVEGDPSLNDMICYTQTMTWENETGNDGYIVSHTTRSQDQEITSISVLPLRVELHCPEVQILEGGMYESKVKLRLKSTRSGSWGCKITICCTPPKN
ncbi:hypothetical protein L9F63_022201 [Diploptera punctata]|uniref:Uncharacterized protein n=1 Tax=Diploptera punctata TaxID=6984 RepID=A0AAD7ZMF2_DIPPU|nr:hypothetical protein L9F63_022201 [Diploptera punctata]